MAYYIEKEGPCCLATQLVGRWRENRFTPFVWFFFECESALIRRPQTVASKPGRRPPLTTLFLILTLVTALPIFYFPPRSMWKGMSWMNGRKKKKKTNNNKSQKRLQWEVGKTDDSLNIALFFPMTTWTAECVSKDMHLASIMYEKCLIWDTVCTINFLHIFPLNQTFFFIFLTRGHSASNYTLDKGHKAQRCFKM